MSTRGGPSPAVEVDTLTVKYGDLIAVDGISFAANAGEILAILGPNGAGKTSTVECAEGYRSPSAGQVRVLGLDPITDRANLAQRAGVVLQSGGVYPMMGSARALRLFASYYATPRDPGQLLETFGLSPVAKTPYKRLSGGERQRLALALALVGNPEVAFLDEPTAGVDPAGRLIVREILAKERDKGTCIVLTSHELDEVERIADRVVIIDHGRVVADGTPGEIAGPGGIRFTTAAGLDTTSLSNKLGGIPIVESSPGVYNVSLASDPAVVASIAGWLADQQLSMESLEAGRERLEDIFLRLVGGS